MDGTRHEVLRRRRVELYKIRRANETPAEAAGVSFALLFICSAI